MCDGIQLIYIFDGRPHKLKTGEIERRRKVKQDATEKYNLALQEGRIDDAKKFSQGTSILTSNIVEESKNILSLMGIPHISQNREWHILVLVRITTPSYLAQKG